VPAIGLSRESAHDPHTLTVPTPRAKKSRVSSLTDTKRLARDIPQKKERNMRIPRNTIAVALLITMGLAGSAFAVRQVHTANGVAAVTLVTESEISFIGSTTFQNLIGATATITVPVGQVQLVQAEFSSDSTCQGAYAENFCRVQILADGAEMSPIAAGDFAFDGVGTADDFYEGHAMQRSILLGPGVHTIRVQAAVTLPGMAFYLDDWSLNITQYNNGR